MPDAMVTVWCSPSRWTSGLRTVTACPVPPVPLLPTAACLLPACRDSTAPRAPCPHRCGICDFCIRRTRQSVAQRHAVPIAMDSLLHPSVLLDFKTLRRFLKTTLLRGRDYYFTTIKRKKKSKNTNSRHRRSFMCVLNIRYDCSWQGSFHCQGQGHNMKVKSWSEVLDIHSSQAVYVLLYLYIFIS